MGLLIHKYFIYSWILCFHSISSYRDLLDKVKKLRYLNSKMFFIHLIRIKNYRMCEEIMYTVLEKLEPSIEKNNWRVTSIKKQSAGLAIRLRSGKYLFDRLQQTDFNNQSSWKTTRSLPNCLTKTLELSPRLLYH